MKTCNVIIGYTLSEQGDMEARQIHKWEDIPRERKLHAIGIQPAACNEPATDTRIGEETQYTRHIQGKGEEVWTEKPTLYFCAQHAKRYDEGLKEKQRRAAIEEADTYTYNRYT